MPNRTEVLDRIKILYKLPNNSALAAFLEVTPQTVSNWYSRNTFDYSKVIAKCSGPNLGWILTGKGKPVPEPSLSTTYTSIEAETETNVSDIVEPYDQNSDLQTLPLYTPISASEVVTILGDSGKIRPISHIRLPKIQGGDGAISAASDSMCPPLKKGDIVVYELTPEIPGGIVWGQTYLLALRSQEEDRLSICRIQPGCDLNHIGIGDNGREQIALSEILAIARVKTSICSPSI